MSDSYEIVFQQVKAEALTKHASGQRTTGTFPKLSDGIKQQNDTAQQIVGEILGNPKSTYTNLGRGGLRLERLTVEGFAITVMAHFLGLLTKELK
ncbi:hypothetical protein LJR232_005899 [Aquipseudomonas alcaligenes]